MATKLMTPPSLNDHHQGTLNAPVVLVEYADFECPYCEVVASVIDQLRSEYRADLCFVFRHFPLNGIHPDAELAAMASEAADQQGQFWNMHQVLYKNQDHLSRDMIEMLARRLKLDMDQFHHDIQRYDLREKIKNDHRSGRESGVESTPSIFINGSRFEGSSSYWPLREVIETHLGGGESLFI
jgi:protein-disulfide isomerase